MLRLKGFTNVFSVFGFIDEMLGRKRETEGHVLLNDALHKVTLALHICNCKGVLDFHNLAMNLLLVLDQVTLPKVPFGANLCASRRWTGK